MSCIQHILNENAVASGGIVDQHVGDRSDELAVLNDGRARHECVQVGTTHFYKLLTVSTSFVKKPSFRIVVYIYFVFQEDGMGSFP